MSELMSLYLHDCRELRGAAKCAAIEMWRSALAQTLAERGFLIRSKIREAHRYAPFWRSVDLQDLLALARHLKLAVRDNAEAVPRDQRNERIKAQRREGRTLKEIACEFGFRLGHSNE